MRVARGARPVLALGALAALLLFPAAAPQAGLPGDDVEVIDGDWTIESTEVRTDATVFMRGNVTIESGGRLELHHANLVLGRPGGGADVAIFEVRPGGAFRMDATAAGPSTLTSNETWIRYQVNGTFESVGTAAHRNRIEWVWGENGYDPEAGAIVPLFPDGGSRSGIRLDHGAVGTVAYTDVQNVGIRHFIVAQASLTLEHVTLKANDPQATTIIALQGVAAARSSQVVLRDVTVEPAHTALYVVSAENVLVEESRLTGGVALGHSGTSPVAVQAKRGVVTIRDSTLTAPGNVVLVESNASVVIEDSTLSGYADIGLSALGLKEGGPFSGTPEVTLRRVTFAPGAPSPNQNGVQTVFTRRLVVEESTLSGHRGNGIVAINTTTVLRGSEFHANLEWGAWLHGGVLEREEDNDFGTGATANRNGRILQDLTLYVRVLDGDGDPLSNATVKAFDKDGKEVFSDLTRGPNPDDPESAAKEGWLLDPHYLLGFRRLNDGTTEERVPYTLEASKRGYPTKTVVLPELRWQRIGITLAGEPGQTDPIVGGDAVDNPFVGEDGPLSDGPHDHGDHGSDTHRLRDKIPATGALGALAGLGLAAWASRRAKR